MGGAPAIKKMTAEEFLAFEEASDVKHEFFDGEVLAMAGASVNHNRIVRNALVQIEASLPDKCESFVGDMRVQTKAMNTYTYPDIVIACGELELLEGKTATLSNPTVIIEVLSPSTEDYDRSKKFVRYKLIPSLQTYVLISSEEKKLEVCHKKDAFTWVITEYREGEFELNVASIKINIDALYKRVDFESTTTDDTPTRF